MGGGCFGDGANFLGYRFDGVGDRVAVRGGSCLCLSSSFGVNGIWGVERRTGGFDGCFLLGGTAVVVASKGAGPSVGPSRLYKSDQMTFDTVAPDSPVEGVEEASEFFVANGEVSWSDADSRRDAKFSKVVFHKAVEGGVWVYRSFQI